MSTTELPSEAKQEGQDTASILAAARAKSGTKSKQTPKPKKFADKAWNSSMKFIRRVHLYSGIFMLPWVLLYGFTGWFFNHPGYFRGDQVTSFSASDVADGQLASLPKPDTMAASIVDELNIESFMVDGPEIKLTNIRPAEFTGFLTYSVRAEDAEHSIEIDPVSGNGEIRTTFQSQEEEHEEVAPPSNPLENFRPVEITENAMAMGQAAAPRVLSDLGLSSGEARTGRRSANLKFSAEVDGTPCIVTYNLSNGSVTALREDSKPTTDTKRFLERLHLARQYSPHWNVQWFWALTVDLMFVSMVFWGLSGILMWWQIKRTRLLGGGFFVASVICAVLLMVGMYDNMATSGRGRGGGGGGGGGGRPAPAPVETQANVPKIAVAD
ncbi:MULTISPECIES: PepSY domain-containing protein [Pirellulaceae]|nr:MULTISPECIES: PepSY domain-containing protein [Pirellulaceae]